MERYQSKQPFRFWGRALLAIALVGLARSLVYANCATYNSINIVGPTQVTEEKYNPYTVAALCVDGSTSTSTNTKVFIPTLTQAVIQECGGTGNCSNNLGFTNGLLTIHIETTVGNGTIVPVTIEDDNRRGTVQSTIDILSYSFVDHFVVAAQSPETAGTSYTVTITAYDASNNVVITQNDSAILSAAVGNAFYNGTTNIMPASAWNNGVASIPVTLYGGDPITRLNTITVTNGFTYPGQSQPATGTSSNILINPGPYTGVVMIFPGETFTPGTAPGKGGSPSNEISGVAVGIVKVRAVDQYWNEVTSVPGGLQLTFSSNTPGDTVPGPQAMSANEMDFNNAFTLVSAGVTHQITVTESINTTTSISNVPVIDAGLDHFTFTNISSPQTTTIPFSETIKALDINNNVVASYNGTLSVLCNVGNTTINTNPLQVPPVQTITFVNGVWNGSIETMLEDNGEQLSISDGNGHTGTSNLFNVFPGPFTTVLMSYPGQVFTQGIYPGNDPNAPPNPGNNQTPLIAGTQVPIDVRTTDASWNVISPGSGVLLSLSPQAGFFINELPADITRPLDPSGDNLNSAGLAYHVTFLTAGTQHLSASAGSAAGQSSNIVVAPASYDRLVMVSPGETLQPGNGETGSPTNPSAGVSFNVTVYATDAFFNPLTNPPYPRISFTSSDPSAVLPPTTTMSGSSQVFPITLKSLNGQTVTVTDVVTSSDTSTDNYNVVPGPLDHYVWSNIPSPQNAGVNIAVTITGKDALGDTTTAVNRPVNLTASTGAGTVSPASVNLTNGVFSGNIQALASGATVYFTATDPSTPSISGLSNIFTVNPGVYSKLLLLLPGETATPGVAPGKTGSTTPQTAGNAFSATIEAVDALWNPVSIQPTVNLSSNRYATYADGNIFVLNGNGQRVTSITPRTAAVHSVTVFDQNNGSITGSTSTITVSPSSYAKIQLLLPGEVADPGTFTANGKTAAAPNPQLTGTVFTATVTAVDAFWNVVPSVNSGQGHIIDSGGSIAANPPPNQNFPFVNGQISFNIFIGNSGSDTLTGSDNSDPSKTPQSDLLTVNQGPTYQITVASSAVAVQNFPVTVSLVDSSGTIVSSANNAINLSAVLASGGPASGSLSPTTATLVNGTVTFNANYAYVESIKIQVTDAFSRIGLSNPISINANGYKYVVTMPATATAGPPSQANATVQLEDSIAGTLIKSKDHSLNILCFSNLTGTVGLGTFTVSSATLSQGTVTFPWSYTKAEDIFITVTDATNFLQLPIPLSGSSNVCNVGADTYKKLLVVAPGEIWNPGVPSLTGKTVQASSEPVGGVFNVNVYAVDQFWNQNQTVNGGQVTLTSSDGSLTGSNPANNGAAFVNGLQSFAIAIYTTGSQTVTAADAADGTKNPQTDPIDISGVTYQFINISTNVFAGPPPSFSMTVRLFDTDTQSQISYTGPVTFTAVDASHNPLPTNVGVTTANLAGGVVTVSSETYSLVQTIIIKAQDGLGRVGYSPQINVQPSGIAFTLALPSSTQAGQNTPLTIRYYDTGTNNVIPNPNSTLTLSAIDATTGLPATGILTPGSVFLTSGNQTANITYTLAPETIYLHGVDSVSGGTANSGLMTVSPAAPVQVIGGAPPTSLANAPLVVTATVEDSFGNPVVGQPVLFHSLGIVQGSLGADQTITTNGSGVATATFTPSLDANGLWTMSLTAGSAVGEVSGQIEGTPKTTLTTSGISSGSNIKPTTLISFTVTSSVPGTVQTFYSIDGGTWLTFSAPFSIQQLGQHTINYWSLDSAGQQEKPVNQQTLNVSAIVSNQLVNFPNPFKAGRESTHIEYTLGQAQAVDAKIYDFYGRLVWQQSYGANSNGGSQGLNRIDWDGTNGNGIVVANGAYVVVVHATSDGSVTKRTIAVVK